MLQLFTRLHWLTGKKLGFRLVVLKVKKVISRWQGVILKIDYGLFRVLGLKYVKKSPYGFAFLIFFTFNATFYTF